MGKRQKSTDSMILVSLKILLCRDVMFNEDNSGGLCEEGSCLYVELELSSDDDMESKTQLAKPQVDDTSED